MSTAVPSTAVRPLAPQPSPARLSWRTFVASATLLLAAAVAACGETGTSPVSPSTPAQDVATTAQISTDVAHDAGDASATLHETFGTSEAASGAFASMSPATNGLLFETAPSTACTGPNAAGFYTCIRTQENGFTVDRSIRYWAGGSVALRYSEAATDSVNHRWTITGTHATSDTSNGGTSRTANVSRADTATMRVVRGASPAHVWNAVGVRKDTTSATDKNGTRRYVVTAFDTASGVTYLLPRKTNPWPASGSMIHNVTTVWTSVKGAITTTTRRAVVTFNGTRTATVQAGALTCSVDLKTHVASGCR